MAHIEVTEHISLQSSDEGYTLWLRSLGIPVILSDAPFDRLESDPEYKEWFTAKLDRYAEICHNEELNTIISTLKE